jgi:hypothetical protein
LTRTFWNQDPKKALLLQFINKIGHQNLNFKTPLAGLIVVLGMFLLVGCESDQTPTGEIKKKVDSLNNKVMEQLRKDSINQNN